MSKKSGDGSANKTQIQGELRSYPLPGKKQLVLACRKCRKKLRRSGDEFGIANLKKTLKKRAHQDPEGLRLKIIEVSCLKMCPKGGITTCSQWQFGRGESSILRTGVDVDVFYEQCRKDAAECA